MPQLGCPGASMAPGAASLALVVAGQPSNTLNVSIQCGGGFVYEHAEGVCAEKTAAGAGLSAELWALIVALAVALLGLIVVQRRRHGAAIRRHEAEARHGWLVDEDDIAGFAAPNL